MTPQNMKILFVSYLSGVGGGEQFIFNLIASLLKKGVSCHVLLTSKGLFENKLEKLDIPIDILNFSNQKKFLSIIKIPLIIIKICQIIYKNKIDVVHINDVEMGKIAGISSKIMGKPVIWTSHGWWYTGFLREKFYDIFFNKVVFVSNIVKDKYKYIGRKEKCSVIHLGVDTEKFSKGNVSEYKKEFKLLEKDIIISMIGRYQKLKRHDLFIGAAKMILKKQKNVKFLIVGGNVFNVAEDEENRLKIFEMVKNDPLLDEHFIFIEFMDRIEKIYAISDIVVSLSDFESFGMIHIESMSSECAIVSTRSGGPLEIIENQKNGILIEKGEIVHVVEAITDLVQNEKKRKEISANARTHIRSNFSLEKMSERYFELYKEIRHEPQ